MSVWNNFAAISIAVTAAGISTEASAVTMKITATGTVLDGKEFSSAPVWSEQDLDGLPFALSFIFDTALGFRDNQGPYANDRVIGGTDFGYASPTISAKLTVNGRSYTSTGLLQSVYSVCSEYLCGTKTIYMHTEDRNMPPVGLHMLNILHIGLFGLSSAYPTNLETPFSFLASAGGTSSARFQFAIYDPITFLPLTYTVADLFIDQASMSQISVAPVPLPAAGLALAGALGGLGALARRRRAAA